MPGINEDSALPEYVFISISYFPLTLPRLEICLGKKCFKNVINSIAALELGSSLRVTRVDDRNC